MEMLGAISFDARRQQVHVHSLGSLLASVSELWVDAALTSEIAWYVRRRVGPVLPIEWSKPWKKSQVDSSFVRP